MKKFVNLIVLSLIICSVIFASSLIKAEDNHIPAIYINGQVFRGRMCIQGGILYVNASDLMKTIDIKYIYNYSTKQHYIDNKVFDSSYVMLVENQYYLYLKAAMVTAGATRAEYIPQQGVIVIEFPVAQICGTITWPGTQGSNQPLAGCPISLADSYGATYRQAVTDKDGRFIFQNIKAGNYILKCSANVGQYISMASGVKNWTVPVAAVANSNTQQDLDNNNVEGKLAPVNLVNNGTKPINEEFNSGAGKPVNEVFNTNSGKPTNEVFGTPTPSK